MDVPVLDAFCRFAGQLERAQPLPPMPNEVPQAQLDLILPLEFTLR
jgi:hypothetical protein